MHSIRYWLGRTLPVVFFIAAQLFGLYLCVRFGKAHFAWLYGVGGALSVGVAAYIVCRKGMPERKLPWLLCLVLFPFWTAVLYLLFSVRKVQKSRVHDAVWAAYRKARAFTPAPEQKGPERFLYRTTATKGSFGNEITYYATGETFFAALQADLQRAQKFIFLEYFIIARGKMWEEIAEILLQKAKEGVEVRILMDAFGSMGRLSAKYCRFLRRNNVRIRAFNRLSAVLSASFDCRDHRKIAVIDGVTGYTGGANISDEYVNLTHPYGKWKDTAVRICGAEAHNLTALFLEQFDATKKPCADYGRYFPVVQTEERVSSEGEAEEKRGGYADGENFADREPGADTERNAIEERGVDAGADSDKRGVTGEPGADGEIVASGGRCANAERNANGGRGWAHCFGDVPERFGFDRIGQNVYLDILNRAKRYAYIMTPYLALDYRTLCALRLAALRGVDVRIVTPHIPDKKAVFRLTRSYYAPLKEAGVRIFEWEQGFLHAKAILADGTEAVVGSINLDFRSMSHHFECGALLCEEAVLADIERDFAATMRQSVEVCRLPKENFLKKAAVALLRLFAPLL